VRGEFDALRRVARLASDLVESGSRESLASPALQSTLGELAHALEELRERFPYLLEHRFEGGDELGALLATRLETERAPI
jgi:hypothetical protein